MIPSNTLEEKAAFDRFSDLMAKLMVKHGPSVLKRRKERLIEAIRSSVDIKPGIPSEKLIFKTYRQLDNRRRLLTDLITGEADGLRRGTEVVM